MLLAALGVGVFAAYVKLNPNAGRVPDAVRRPAIESTAPAPTPRITHRRSSGPDVSIAKQTELRLPVVKGDDVALGHAVGQVPAGEKPMVFLANATLHELRIDKARALGVQIKDRNALVDFNEALDKGYGSTEEGYLIKSLQLALGQFPEIDTFQIVINGEVKDSLGQIDLSEPITVIRPDGKEAKPSTTPAGDQEPPAPN
jgi:hypothetical protein